MREGRFREDLFYRLGVVPLRLPPLREWPADTVPLVEHFLALIAGGQPPKQLSTGAAARLLSYEWPGNVRELRNAIERAAALSHQPVLQAADLNFLAAGPPQAVAVFPDIPLPEAVRQLEEAMIRRALAGSAGNRAEAAKRLGIHRQLLHTKMRNYGIEGREGRGCDVGRRLERLIGAHAECERQTHSHQGHVTYKR